MLMVRRSGGGPRCHCSRYHLLTLLSTLLWTRTWEVAGKSRQVNPQERSVDAAWGMVSILMWPLPLAGQAATRTVTQKTDSSSMCLQTRHCSLVPVNWLKTDSPKYHQVGGEGGAESSVHISGFSRRKVPQRPPLGISPSADDRAGPLAHGT